MEHIMEISLLIIFVSSIIIYCKQFNRICQLFEIIRLQNECIKQHETKEKLLQAIIDAHQKSLSEIVD